MRGVVSLVAAGVLVAAFSSGIASAAPDRDKHDGSTLVMTQAGPVQGTATSSLRQFLGIPYAAAPVGDRRWRPPEPHAPWLAPLDASHFGRHCPQPEGAADLANASEDCLFLNVYT